MNPKPIPPEHLARLRDTASKPLARVGVLKKLSTEALKALEAVKQVKHERPS